MFLGLVVTVSSKREKLWGFVAAQNTHKFPIRVLHTFISQ